MTNLHTEMYQGQLTGEATLNVATRVARFAALSDFDVQKAIPLIPKVGRDWFERQQFTWEKPPRLRGSGTVTLAGVDQPASRLETRSPADTIYSGRFQSR